MIISEWITRDSQITKANADANQSTDLFVANQKMLLTSVGMYQHQKTTKTIFDALSSQYRYESRYQLEYAATDIELRTHSDAVPHAGPENELARLYVPEVWLWIGRNGHWYRYHTIKKSDKQTQPHRTIVRNDFVLLAGDKVHAYIQWPKLKFRRDGEPVINLTERQKQQINGHVGSLVFHIQGVRA